MGSLQIISIQNYMKCSACLEIAASPIFSCDEGHILCGICNEYKNKECVVCRKKVSINGLLERILRSENVNFPCRNRGCIVKIQSCYMKSHLDNCGFARFPCLEFKTASCDKYKTYSPRELLRHWKDHHKINAQNVTLSKSNGSFIKTACPSYSLKTDKFQSTSWASTDFKIEDTTFFCHAKCISNVVYIWVTCWETEVDAKQYKFNLFISDKCSENSDNTITLTNMTVHSLRYYELEKIQETGDYGTVHTNALVQRFTKVESQYTFKVKVEIF